MIKNIILVALFTTAALTLGACKSNQSCYDTTPVAAPVSYYGK